MHDARSIRLLLVAALAVAVVASSAVAAPRCEKSCKAETAACIGERCAGLGGAARHACLETCKGIGGCARTQTLAYVVSECTARAFHQKLQIRHGGCDPVTVLDLPGPVEADLPCALIGSFRNGVVSSPIVGVFQRLGVSPDGRHVVFEVTDDFSVFGVKVPPGQEEGIFIVRADGRGQPRRIGPASLDPPFRFEADPASPNGFRAYGAPDLSGAFSRDSDTIVLPDLGPGPGGEEAVQIFTLDLVTGHRIQLTHLPFVADRPVGTLALEPGTGTAWFGPGGRRIGFSSHANIDGSNPEGSFVGWVMNRDGSGLERIHPLPVPLPGSTVVPIFGVTGSGRQTAGILSIPGIPENPTATGRSIVEIFFFDGKTSLQLTNFHRVDTGFPWLTGGGQRVIFVASADPVGKNRSGTCQLFSVGTDGLGLRQLTQFSQPEYSADGCQALRPPGCLIYPFSLDRATGMLLFYSSCDPFGTNPYGDQLFTIRQDGTGLRQLTQARGRVTDADGAVSAENIGPYSATLR